MTLYEYLTQPKNSIIREDFTTSTLITELKLSAILKMRRLKIYKQEIDIEGCDLIIEDDSDIARKYQLKSIIFDGQRKSFEIHSNILLPDFNRCGDYGFDNVICPKTMGGVIKILIIPKDDGTTINLKYEYTDFNVISYYAHYEKRKAAVNLLKRLEMKTQRVYVNRDLFIPLANASSILKIAGFFNECEFDNYCNRYNKLYRGREQSTNREKEMKHLLSNMNNFLSELNNG
jgi:hypothetical protein